MVTSSNPVGTERSEMVGLGLQLGKASPVVDLFPESLFLETMPCKTHLCIGVGVISQESSFDKAYWCCRIAKAWSEHFKRQGCVVVPSESLPPLQATGMLSCPLVDVQHWDWLGEISEFDNPLPRRVVQDIASLSAIRSKYSSTWLDLGSLGNPRMRNLVKLCDGVVLVSEPDSICGKRIGGDRTVGDGNATEKPSIEQKRSPKQALDELRYSGCRVLGYWDVAIS